MIVDAVENNGILTAAEIANDKDLNPLLLSRYTVNRILKSNGLHKRKAIDKIDINLNNSLLRSQWSESF